MAVYFRNHPEEESRWLPLLAVEAASQVHFCEFCDVEFESETALVAHEDDEHETCGLEGCTFTANAEILQDHIMDVHASGLYARLHNKGTSEDTEKWRDERKKHFPTVARRAAIAAKLAVKAERKARAEERMHEERRLERPFYEVFKKEAREKARREWIEMEGERREANRREREVRKMRAKTHYPDWSNEPDSDEDHGGVPPFRGTASLVKTESDDEEEDVVPGGDAMSISDDEDAKPVNLRCVEADSSGEDDEPPDEVATERVDELPKVEQQNAVENVHPVVSKEPETNAPSDRKARKRHRGLGVSPGVVAVPKPPDTPDLALRRNLFKLRTSGRLNNRGGPTLLEKLLAADIRRERSELLQCVKYVCEKNFFGIGGEK